MNWLLIMANVTVFLALGLRPDYEDYVINYGFVPADFRATTIFSSMFLHGDVLHLLGNMWFLYLFGPTVENRCGPFKYLCAYLLAGLAGTVCQYEFFPDSLVPVIGASGAIFGILGMYFFFFPSNRVKVFYFIFIFIGVMAVRAIWVIGCFFVLELLYSHMQTAAGLETGIGHLAHSGGFVAGFLLAGIYLFMGLVTDDRRHLLAQLTGRGAPDFQIARTVREQFWKREDEPEDEALRQIMELLREGRPDEAKRVWRRYAFDHPQGVLPVREQLEIALALDRNKESGVARDAYERLLEHYPNEQPYAAEANLALAGMLLQEAKETGNVKELPLIRRLLIAAAATHPSAGQIRTLIFHR